MRIDTQRTREQHIVGQRVTYANFAHGFVHLLFEDGTRLRISDSGPLDGRDERNFYVDLAIPAGVTPKPVEAPTAADYERSLSIPLSALSDPWTEPKP